MAKLRHRCRLLWGPPYRILREPFLNYRVIFSASLMLGLTACEKTPATIADNAIISTTLCADSYILAMPDLKDQIGALSWQSRSDLSLAPNDMRALPQIGENIEALAQYSDQRIVSGPGPSAVTTAQATLKWGEDFDIVWENFTLLSDTLNTPNPSEDLQARLSAVPKSAQTPRVLYINRAGGSAGPGTFVDAVIEAAGGENVITTSGWQSPDTEALILYEPDVILTSFLSSDYIGVNDRLVRHAALSEHFESLPHINAPGALWPCAGPGLVEATEILAQGLAEL